MRFFDWLQDVNLLLMFDQINKLVFKDQKERSSVVQQKAVCFLKSKQTGISDSSISICRDQTHEYCEYVSDKTAWFMIGKFRDRIVRALDQITHVLHFFWGDNLGSLEVNDHFNIVDLVLQCKTLVQNNGSSRFSL